MPVETKPSGLVYFNPFSEERIRLTIPEGDHTLRLGFIDDPFVKTLAKEDIYKDSVNKWIGAITVIGPFATTGDKPSRKRILVCDPAIRSPLCRSDPGDRRTARVSAARDRNGRRGVAEVRDAGEERGPVGGAGDCPRDPGDARVAAFPVSHRAGSLSRPTRRGCTESPTSSWRRG